MEQTIDNQVAVIHNSIELFRSAPEILKANQERTAKAIAVGNSILAQWHEAWAIEDEEERLSALSAADERSNKYLVNCAGALKEEKEARAAITQMMDAFKKMFTEAENELDRTKPNTVTSKVQNNRDTYVGEVAKIQERKRKEAERVAAKAKEEIEIRSFVEKWILDKLITLLASRKEFITNAFNHICLDNYDEKAERLKTMRVEALGSDLQERITTTPTLPNTYYHDQAEREAITNSVMNGFNYSTWSLNNWTPELTALKNDLVDKLPSKLAELQEHKRLADEAEAERKRQEEAEAERQRQIAAANAKEKVRLEAEAAEQRKRDQERLEQLRREQEEAETQRRQREAEEEARLKKEAEEAKQKAELEAEAKKQAEQTLVLFEQEASLADNAAAPESRQGYEITVLHQAGYVQIFTLWFEKEGKTLPIDKLGNTKLDQMKAWAEKHAHKTGEKIESKFLRYDESFKAVNRKVK